MAFSTHPCRVEQRQITPGKTTPLWRYCRRRHSLAVETALSTQRPLDAARRECGRVSAVIALAVGGHHLVGEDWGVGGQL